VSGVPSEKGGEGVARNWLGLGRVSSFGKGCRPRIGKPGARGRRGRWPGEREEARLGKALEGEGPVVEFKKCGRRADWQRVGFGAKEKEGVLAGPVRIGREMQLLLGPATVRQIRRGRGGRVLTWVSRRGKGVSFLLVGKGGGGSLLELAWMKEKSREGGLRFLGSVAAQGGEEVVASLPKKSEGLRNQGRKRGRVPPDERRGDSVTFLSVGRKFSREGNISHQGGSGMGRVSCRRKESGGSRQLFGFLRKERGSSAVSSVKKRRFLPVPGEKSLLRHNRAKGGGEGGGLFFLYI